MELSELSQLLKTQLAHLLESIPESKDLVLDANLMKPLDRIVGISFLKSHGVSKIFKLEQGQKSLPGCGNRIYFVRPRMVTMKYIADQINTERSNGEKRSYKVVMVPRRIHVCESVLENEGVMGHVNLDEFPLDLFPLENDLLSFELPEFFKSLYLDNDTTWLHTVAFSLVNFQRLYKKIPNVYTIGRGSKMVSELMKTMFENHEISKDTTFNVGHLFIVDRDVDLVAPLCSPMTYEALLDETFGIDCGMIDFDSSVTGKNESTKMLLTGQDEIYGQIRDRHFSDVTTYLSGKAKDLKAIYDRKNNLKTVGDMKDYVANELKVLKHQQNVLATHVSACEAIMKYKEKTDFEEYTKTEHMLLDGSETRENISYIEQCIHKQFSMVLTLRQMCLLSLTQEGLSQRDYKSLKTQFIHSHGFEQMITLFNLKKVGLMNEQESPTTARSSSSFKKSNYKALNRKFSLVPQDPCDFKNPADSSYIFNGAYTPLICKLIEQILRRDTNMGWDDIIKVMGAIQIDAKVPNRSNGAPGGKISDRFSEPAMKVVLVCFLGGCTFSEITALRFLSRNQGIKIIIATTSVITGNGLIDSLIEKTSR